MRSEPPQPTGDVSPVFGIMTQPTLVDYDGYLAALFFVAGCNFRCGFCHNPALLGPPRRGLSWPALAVRCRGFAANWVDAAVISGGEPTLAAGLGELVAFLRGEYGWRIKLDTNGSQPEALARVIDAVDYVAMDIKCAPASYGAVTGFADTAAITASLRLVRERAADYEFRTTVLEPLHSDAEMDAVGEWIAGAKRYVLQPFVPRADLPDPACGQARRTSPDRLAALAARLRGRAREIVVRGEDVAPVSSGVS